MSYRIILSNAETTQEMDYAMPPQTLKEAEAAADKSLELFGDIAGRFDRVSVQDSNGNEVLNRTLDELRSFWMLRISPRAFPK